MRNICSILALSLAAAAAPVLSAPPQRVEIGYDVTRNGTPLAELSQRLEHDGRSYRLAETWRGRGVLALRGEAARSSRGAVVADGLRPRKFEDKRSGRDTTHAEFDPAANTATLLRQDRLSFVWTFAFFPPTGPVTVSVADGKGVSTYTFQPAGRERLKTPAGEFDALKLVKRRDHPQDKPTEIWLAADRDYLPVRVLVVDKDGTRLDTLASKITQ